MKSFAKVMVVAAVTLGATAANATVSVSAVQGGSTYTGPTPTYDWDTAATTPTTIGGGVRGPGTTPFFYAQPLGSTGQFYTVGPSTSSPGTILFGSLGLTGLSFIWGSIDTYNSITFTDLAGNPLIGPQYTWTGSQIAAMVPAAANGSQVLDAQNPIVSFLFSGIDSALIGGMQMTSTQNAFEIDNIALTGSAVPEPGTWAMMLLGFGAIGFAMRRRKSTAALRQLA